MPMQQILFYGVIAATAAFYLSPMVRVSIKEGKAATRAEWIEAMPWLGLFFCLLAVPLGAVTLGLLGAQFFALIALGAKKSPLK
jgi:hypothetical protein